MELTQHQRKLFGGLSDSQLNLLLRLVNTVHEMSYASVTTTIHAGKVVEIQKTEKIGFQKEIVRGVVKPAYQAYRNVTFNFTTFIGRQPITAQSATPKRWITPAI